MRLPLKALSRSQTLVEINRHLRPRCSRWLRLLVLPGQRTVSTVLVLVCLVLVRVQLLWPKVLRLKRLLIGLVV